MTIVRNQITDTQGKPAPGWVISRLVGPGLRPATQTEIIAQSAHPTAADGTWSLDLSPNSVEAPYYVISEQAGDYHTVQHVIHVPDSDTPVWLGDVVVLLPLPVGRADAVYAGPPGPPGPPGDGGGGADGTADVPDATAALKGKLRLAGVLAGTAAEPDLAPGAVQPGHLGFDLATQLELDQALAFVRARANHTGTQGVNTIAGLAEFVQQIIEDLTPDAQPDPEPEPLPRPTDVVATLLPDHVVRLDWTALAGATKYNVYEARSGSTPVATVTTNTRTSGSLGSVTNPVYVYTVTAVYLVDGQEVESPASDPVSIDVTANDTPTEPDPTDPTPTDPTPAPTGQPVFSLNDQTATLSTTSAAALRAKAIADMVKAGTAPNNIKDVDNRVGPTALTTFLWWKRTGDASYLAPLKTYILAAPRPPSTVQALNEMRAYGGLLAAVDGLMKNGQWNDAALCPNHGNIAWSIWLKGGGDLAPLATRRLDTSTSQRWRDVKYTAVDALNNWGAVGRWAYQMIGVVTGNQAIIDESEDLYRKYLGEQNRPKAPAFFYASNNYRGSWDNWYSSVSDGSGYKGLAGIGKTDPDRPGLDGVVLNDIDRGSTDYSPGAAFYGASGSGLSYPMEAADYIWAQFVCWRNMGYRPETWGEGGDAFRRMNDRFARIRTGDSQSLFDYCEAKSAVYYTGKAIARRLTGKSYGTEKAAASGVNGLSRAMPYGDWLAATGSAWGS